MAEASYFEASSSRAKKAEGKKGKGLKLSTDAQSIAARERRQRISHRFKILQSLVPGGNKLDTVSMLDEAIRYVKFLKAQLWLLRHHQSLFMDYSLHEYDQYADFPCSFLPASSLTDPFGHGTGFVGVEEESDAMPLPLPPLISNGAYSDEESLPFDAWLLPQFP